MNRTSKRTPTPLRHLAIVLLSAAATISSHAQSAAPSAATNPAPAPPVQVDLVSAGARLDAMILNHPTAQRTSIALRVADAETGAVLYDHHGGHLLTPASTQKLFTAACALDTFGIDRTFETQIQGTVSAEGNRLSSALRVHGGGDSLLSGAEVDAMVDTLIRAFGIESIAGEVTVINPTYGEKVHGPGWMWDDMNYSYQQPITPLMVDLNLRPDASDADGVPVEDPRAAAIDRVTRRLNHHGVEVEGIVDDSAAQNLEVLVTHERALPDLLDYFLDKSENAIGEVLLHELAIEAGREADWSNGAAVISDWLMETAGAPEGSFRLVDGSGLSRYNAASPEALVTLLVFMHHHEDGEAFRGFLNTYDVGDAEIVHAKSGGMTSVSTISGYLRTDSGRWLVFSYMANGYIGGAAPIRDLRGQIWAELRGW